MALKGRSGLDKAIDKQIKFKDNTLKGFYLTALNGIKSGTPVDEGRARNNWFLSVGAPFTGTTKLTNGNNSEVNKMPTNVIGKRLFYSNNLPYINKLEYGGYPGNGPKTSVGFSDQAVGGFARVNLLKLRNAIRKIK
jgi:hypothetical protein